MLIFMLWFTISISFVIRVSISLVQLTASKIYILNVEQKFVNYIFTRWFFVIGDLLRVAYLQQWL